MKDIASARPPGTEAQLHYASGSYQVVKPGSWVTCAVTGTPISIEDLRYWSFEHQEAYVDAKTASLAWSRRNNKG